MKTIKITVFSFLFAILIAGHAVAGDIYFHEDFETPGNKLSKWRGIEVAGPKNIEFVTSPVRKGKRALKLSILAGQGKTNFGVRSEISYDNQDRAGSEVWYAWSFLIPENFKDSPANLWQAMGQWHDQPNRDKGETWKTYKGKGNSPPVAVYFGTAPASKALPQLRKKIKNIDQYVVNGTISGVTIKAGTKREPPFAHIPILKGKWNDMMFHIKWSLGNDGFVEVFHNDKFIARKQGRNMWNDYPHYLKLGLYRSPEIRHASHVYYDEVRIGKSRESVSISSVKSGRLSEEGRDLPIGQSTRLASTVDQKLADLKKGDRVVTQGGIHGIVQRLNEDFVILEISRNVKIKINRNAIASVQ